jgi:LEA14-like dessication related protein
VSGLCRLVLIAPLLLAFAGCATLSGLEESPRVSLAALKSLAVEGFEQRYRIKLRVGNPNRQPLVVQNVSFRLYLNDEPFADGVGPADVTIAPFSDALLTVDVTSNLYRLFRQVQRFPGREDYSVHWRVKGSLARAGYGARIPFESEGQLDLVPPDRR